MNAGISPAIQLSSLEICHSTGGGCLWPESHSRTLQGIWDECADGLCISNTEVWVPYPVWRLYGIPGRLVYHH